MKTVTVILLLEQYTEGTKDIEVFRKDKFLEDYQREVQKRFPQYAIKVEFDDPEEVARKHDQIPIGEDEKVIIKYLLENTFYPQLAGDISSDEKEVIKDILSEDDLLLFHADGDYYDPI